MKVSVKKYLSPGRIVVVAAIFYALLTLLMLYRASALHSQLNNLPDRFFLFVHSGSQWDAKAVRPFDTERIGYDGQFFYDLARDPLQPNTPLDKPAYRTARILYPLVVRLFALGQTALIAAMLLLVNFLAIVATTYILACLLVQIKRQAVWAFIYALWPGTICAYLYDLSEPLCFLLIVIALWVQFRQMTVRKVWYIGGLLLLASLTKELALLFGIGWLLYYGSRREWAKLGKLAISWLLPYAIWQVFLLWQFGSDGLSAGAPFAWFPFGGFVGASSFQPPLLERAAILAATIVPVLWVIWLLIKKWRSEVLGLKNYLANPLFFMLMSHLAFLLFLPAASYIYLVDHARNAIGLILVLTLLPVASQRLRLYILSSSLVLSSIVIVAFALSGNAFLAF